MVKHARGFSLVEVMIVLVILGVLLTLAVPFAQRWLQGVDDHRAKTLIENAYQHAKSIAMRSPVGAGALISAGLKLKKDGVLLVCKGDPQDELLCCYEPANRKCRAENHKPSETGANVAWQGEMPKKTTLNIDGIDSGRATSSVQWTIPLNDKGISLKEVSTRTYMGQIYEITIAAGNTQEKYPLH